MLCSPLSLDPFSNHRTTPKVEFITEADIFLVHRMWSYWQLNVHKNQALISLRRGQFLLLLTHSIKKAFILFTGLLEGLSSNRPGAWRLEVCGFRNIDTCNLCNI
jgi:hypothetical protein